MDNFITDFIETYGNNLRRVLIIPPDFTRFHSKAGRLTEKLYLNLQSRSKITVLPALGTHTPLTEEERSLMFGRIPKEVFLTHNWRDDIVEIGNIPSEYVKEISEQKVNYPVKVEINRELLKDIDLIISIGQVVPHEVAGMANGNKNILVGVGGKDIINKSHFLGACYGMERIMGRSDTPVRELFNYASEHFLDELPLVYIHTVIKPNDSGRNTLNGLFFGEKDDPFRKASNLSQKLNVTLLDNTISKVIVYLNSSEYKSTWVGNKAIYRTRMALEDDGEIIILAPGLNRFGEDRKIDSLIRKYGYDTTFNVLDAVEKNTDLRDNLSAAAHLIHGSSEDRFKVTYCTEYLSSDEIKGVKYQYSNITEALRMYNPNTLNEGVNILESGEEIYFIRNPGLGLWSTKKSFLQTK